MPHPTTRQPENRQRGSATVQTMMWLPVLFTIVLVGVQLAGYGWAYLAARHAADQAVQTARVEGGTATAGAAQARLVLDQAAADALHHPQVHVTRDDQHATATVSGQPVQVPLVSLLPLPTIQVHASAPVERFRPITQDTP